MAGMFRLMRFSLSRGFGSVAAFVVGLALMAFVSIWLWDGLINGRVYYCTDGSTMDFLFVGDWVHNPESAARVVPRSMSEPDEIRKGWSITGLWCLWTSFVILSTFVAAWFARIAWASEKRT